MSVFSPKYQWIRVSDIRPECFQKVLIVRHIGDCEFFVDRYVVNTACFHEDGYFVGEENEPYEVDDVLYWSVFPKFSWDIRKE